MGWKRLADLERDTPWPLPRAPPPAPMKRGASPLPFPDWRRKHVRPVELSRGVSINSPLQTETGSHAKLPQRAQGVSLAAATSSRGEDGKKRRKLALAWSGLAEDLRGDSDVLLSIPDKYGDQLAFIFEDRSSATLAKYLRGWQKWLDFCRGALVFPGHPSVASSLNFCDALASGAALDRGTKRVCRAKESVKSLKFVGHKLGLGPLLEGVCSPAVEAWLAQDEWKCAPVKEAVPLPLFVVAKLEHAIASRDLDDQWVIGCVLLMIWGGIEMERRATSTIFYPPSGQGVLARPLLADESFAQGDVLWCLSIWVDGH